MVRNQIALCRGLADGATGDAEIDDERRMLRFRYMDDPEDSSSDEYHPPQRGSDGSIDDEEYSHPCLDYEEKEMVDWSSLENE